MVLNKRSQHGAVLLISLVFMLILTAICASALQSTTLQERMAGNARDTNTAFQAAEAALRAGELVLQGASVGPFDGSNGMYQQCSGTGQECTPPNWREPASTGWRTANAIDDTSSAPQFYIEELKQVDDAKAPLDAGTAVQIITNYRVTARGFGLSDRAMVVLRTIYRRE
ncbi:PilX N-terminal domain-containing pilus assembly protein [Zhongshania guokunii]|uniref:PilX N-terminal domain-containing pilus assembly protein n=1 Tax=Zhongshania guokunii TaxID=641783 RepID=A0ABV3U2R9_9GAMM